MTRLRRLALAALTLPPLASCASLDAKSAACSPASSLRPILSTHTPMVYPPISVRLGEQGVTVLAVTVGSDGAAADVMVKQTSTSERLDAAAVNYVKAHWRWQPMAGECKAAITTVNVTWHIVEEPVPKSALTTQRGMETITVYTHRIQQVSMR